MDRGMNKVVVVTRRTRLKELIYKYNTLEQAKFYIEHMGVDFSDYLLEEENYNNAVKRVEETAEQFARVQTIDREFVPNMLFGARDVVIAVGQDGLVANVMKYLDGQPLLGINPDTRRWDGVLLPFEAGQLKELLPKVLSGNFNAKGVTMAEALTKDGQSMLAVNDLFIGCRTHASARYDISLNQAKENQSSSGIIVSTGLGSTGWYRSVMNQARKMVQLFQNSKIRTEENPFGRGREAAEDPLDWDAEQLHFIVREAYPSRSTQAELIFGEITRKDQFTLVSKMASDGVVFSDGMQEDVISFNAGCEIRVQIAAKKGCLVV